MSGFGSTEVRIEKQNRRTLQIAVKKDWILIKVPHHTTDEEIQSFVISHRHWIEKQLALQKTEKPSNELSVLGQTWTLNTSSSFSGMAIDEANRIVNAPPLIHESDLSRIYRYLAQHLLPLLFKTLCKRLGVNKPPVIIKTLSRAWGVCHSTGRIEFHWGLIQLSEELAIYVMCHELAHLVHLDHSQAFWALCDQYCPGTRRLDRALKTIRAPL